MIQGRNIEAHHIIQSIAKTGNFILLPFKLISPVPVSRSPEPVIYHTADVACVTAADLTPPNDVIADVAEEPSYIDLIKVPYLRRISLPLWYVWFIFGYTYYGIILYINRIYTTTTPNNAYTKTNSTMSYTRLLYTPTATSTTVTITNTTSYALFSNNTYTTAYTSYNTHTNTNTNTAADTMSTCKFDYISILINASAELLGIYICCHIIDKIGRIHTQTIFFILSAIGVIIMSLPSLTQNNPNNDQKNNDKNSDLNTDKINRFLVIFFSYITRLCIMCATSAIWVSTPELYPTYIRATGQ